VFRIRSSLVAQWNRNAAKRARIWLSWLPRSFVFDCYGLQTLAGQAFKCSLVIVGLIGWLDARKKHRHSTRSTGWRQITGLRRIIEMTLLHGGGFPLPGQAGALFVSQLPTPGTQTLSMMFSMDVRPTDESIREGCKYRSILESRRDRKRCKLSKRSLPDIASSHHKLYIGHVRFGS
jgi:hypothetical protein